MKYCILIMLLLILACNDQTSPLQISPNVPANISLLTPQLDKMSEIDAQISDTQQYFWYSVAELDFNEHYFYTLYYQYIDNNERHNILFPDYSYPPSYGFRNIKLAANDQFLLLNDIYLRILSNGFGSLNILTTLYVFEPRISPDNKWIAYGCNYPSLQSYDVFIITPEGDQLGPHIQVTHSESAPSGFIYSFLPVCWLSNNELVVRRQRNKNRYDVSTWIYDMQKYNVDDLSAPPELLTSVEGDEHQPMGYSELINQNEGWYIDSFGDTEAGYSNLFKCPLGVAGDWGQQLTFGGDWDTPTDLTADGKKLIFVRKYRRGSNFLTGNSDIYMMDLDGGGMENISPSALALDR